MAHHSVREATMVWVGAVYPLVLVLNWISSSRKSQIQVLVVSYHLTVKQVLQGQGLTQRVDGMASHTWTNTVTQTWLPPH